MSDLVEQLMKEIHKCYEIAKKKRNSVCTTRSQLLYIALKNNGFKPRMWRYLNSENQEKRVKIKLISGERYISHVAVLLDEWILDSNLPQKISKEEYDRQINGKNKGIIVISKEYWSSPSTDELKRICNECGLSPLFTEALKDPENSNNPISP